MTVDARNLDVLGRTMPDLDQTTMDIICRGPVEVHWTNTERMVDISSKQADLVLDLPAGFGFI
jgi:hypothetical protein